MQFEYAITLEDFREAINSMLPRANRIRPIYSLMYWLIVTAVLIHASIPLSVLYHHSSIFPEFPRKNLWMAISPSLCMTSVLITSLLFAPLIPESTQPKRKFNRAELSAFGLIWLLPAVWPQLSIGWNPSDANQLCAALVPWTIYFGLIRVVYARRRKRRVDEAWAKTRSAHRTNKIEVTQSGVSADDGMVAHRYQWSHFLRYGETAKLLLLTTEDGQLLIIAKRAVPDGPAMDELRMLTSENIKEGSFLNSAKAFPVILPVLEIAEGK
jgi:YcxB-like protein